MPSIIPTPTDLYRYFDAEGQLLYVGISLSAVARAVQHKQTAAWWPLMASMTRETFETRYQALAAESAAIHTERPMYNVAHSTGKWSRVNYKTVAGDYRVARITCRPCTRRPIHNLVVVDCPGCGLEHRHGVTSLDVFRGYADRYPHCQGRSSSWVTDQNVRGAWGEMLVWQQIVIDRDNLPREVTRLDKETHDSRTARDHELRRRWALAAHRITNADGFGLAPISSAPNIEAGYKLFPANP